MLGSRRRVLLVLAVTATLGAMTLFAGAMGATCPGKPGCGDCAFAELLLQLRDDFGASTLTVHVADQSSASDFTAARLRVTGRVGRDTRSAEVNRPQLKLSPPHPSPELKLHSAPAPEGQPIAERGCAPARGCPAPFLRSDR